MSAGGLLGGLCCHGVTALGKVLTPGEKCTFLVREATGQPLAAGSMGLFAFPPAGGRAGPAPRAPQLDGLHLLQLPSSESLFRFSNEKYRRKQCFSHRNRVRHASLLIFFFFERKGEHKVEEQERAGPPPSRAPDAGLDPRPWDRDLS